MKSIFIITLLCFSAEIYAGDCPGGVCPMPQQVRTQSAPRQVRTQSAPRRSRFFRGFFRRNDRG